jgi:hypothetical protein
MKKKTLCTTLWMFAFTLGTLLFGAVVLAILTHTRIVSLTVLAYLDLAFEVVLFLSPLVALWLGLRGVLPGTKSGSESDD